MRLWIQALFLLVAIGCSNVPVRHDPIARPSYDEIISLVLGADRIGEVEKRLGKPGRILEVSATPNMVAWIYYFDGTRQTRASLFFDKSRQVLLKKVIFLEERDRTGQLSNMKVALGNSVHEIVRVPQTSHFVRDEWIYDEKITGRRLVSTLNPEEIGSVSWRIPEAKHANQ